MTTLLSIFFVFFCFFMKMLHTIGYHILYNKNYIETNMITPTNYFLFVISSYFD